ncbi:ABC transporter ATP-binding protein [Desulfovibrio sp. ZJ200]|uniref:ABC transporter ATP-binding protein n=1 Tax=Desulfovibrio sp. ZJ200 TaxID=2709792 RepID=UPI0013EDD133|nr:ABC transporter ATP-binding protein [Desulfovibrio sp. ZJ200]
MTDPVAVAFRHVYKSYPSYYHMTGGIKNVLFHLPSTARELFRRRSVLEDVSFEIKKGECFGFIGRNGAGKSTTLGLIAGVLAPERGEVRVNGRVSPLLELGAGFHPELTGRENILLNGVLLGLTKQEVREHAEEIIAFSELDDFIDQPVRTYSSGMYAKLGFSVVSILKPEILLVDEVLAVGDLAFTQKCEKKFEEFRNNKKVTIIMVSHGLESVAKLCDRAAWVENKRIQAIGSCSEIVAAYRAAYGVAGTEQNNVEDPAIKANPQP